jgi:hypothetical protein
MKKMIATVNQGIMKFRRSINVFDSKIINEIAKATIESIAIALPNNLVFCNVAKTTAQTKMNGKRKLNGWIKPKSITVTMFVVLLFKF